MNDETRQAVLQTIRKYAGKQQIDQDSSVGCDLGILGSDFVELVYEVEDRFGVDIRPLVERGPLERTSWLHRHFGIPPRRSGLDITVKELIDFVVRHQSH